MDKLDKVQMRPKVKEAPKQPKEKNIKQSAQIYAALVIFILVVVGLCASIVWFNVNFDVNIGRYPIAFVSALLGIWAVYITHKAVK